MDQFPPSIWVYHYGHFEFFRKFAEIFAAQGAPPVSTTPVANLHLSIPLRPFRIFSKIRGDIRGSRCTTGVNNTRGIGGKICRRCRWCRWQICRRCRWYRRQFATGVINTGGKFATGVVDTGGAPWLANISANFRKFKMILMLFSGAWGKVIHEKNLKQKISWHCPFKICLHLAELLCWPDDRSG